jgi:hypothetical protein
LAKEGEKSKLPEQGAREMIMLKLRVWAVRNGFVGVENGIAEPYGGRIIENFLRKDYAQFCT